MRTRALIPYLLVPPLLGVLLTSLFVARLVERERNEASDVAKLALSGDLVTETITWVGAETTYLLALDAFTEADGGLAFYERSAESMAQSMGPAALVESLETSDAYATQFVEAAAALDMVPDEIRQILEPLSPDVIDALRKGETHLIDPEPYGRAATWIGDQWTGLQARSEDARAEAVALGDEPPFWQDATFVGFTLATLLLAAAGTLLVIWRIGALLSSVSGRLTHEQERVATLHERGVRLQHLVGVGRRLSSEADIDALSRTLVAETKRFIGGDVVSLVRRHGAEVEPTVVAGELMVSRVAIGDGVVGRCVDSGAPARTLVPSDPFVPSSDGPLSLLVAPLVAEARVIGALVVVAQSEALFDESDEMALHVLVLLAAGALTAAERLDSTRALTLRDPLTGLANRRRMDDDLESVASAEGAAFLMVDIDHFKRFNDVHGHRQGDELLRTVAGAIASAVREQDVVYRYGGEEFSVLLRDTGVVEAGVIAERVREAVRVATARDGADPVTVSVGVAAQSAPVVAMTLVEHADAALYAAKEAGRDRVLVRRGATQS